MKKANAKKVLLDCLIALTGVLLVTAILGAAEPPRILRVRNHCSSAPAVPQQIRVVNRMAVRTRSAEVVESPPPARAAVAVTPVQEAAPSTCANGQCSTQQTVASRGRLRLFR